MTTTDAEPATEGEMISGASATIGMVWLAMT